MYPVVGLYLGVIVHVSRSRIVSWRSSSCPEVGLYPGDLVRVSRSKIVSWRYINVSRSRIVS